MEAKNVSVCMLENKTRYSQYVVTIAGGMCRIDGPAGLWEMVANLTLLKSRSDMLELLNWKKRRVRGDGRELMGGGG